MPREDWSTDDPGYSPSKFYMRGSDKQGHSANLRVHVPTYVAGRVQHIFDTHQFPYKTLQDFYRDAIYHRLYALEHDLFPFEQQDGLALAALRDEAQSVIERITTAKSTVDSLEATVLQLVKLGEEDEARSMVARAYDAAPTNPVASRYYLRLMDERFQGWKQ